MHICKAFCLCGDYERLALGSLKSVRDLREAGAGKCRLVSKIVIRESDTCHRACSRYPGDDGRGTFLTFGTSGEGLSCAE